MRILLTLAICAFLAAPALAAFDGPGAPEQNTQQNTQQNLHKGRKDKRNFEQRDRGGFEGPLSGIEADTVEKAVKLPDDARVLLTGAIINQLAGSRDKFTFKDATGEVVVDIDRKAFRGRTVTPADTVRIAGKVDKDMGKPVEIDVKMLEVVEQ